MVQVQTKSQKATGNAQAHRSFARLADSAIGSLPESPAAASPFVQRQKIFFDSVGNNPAVVAQRHQLEALFLGANQRPLQQPLATSTAAQLVERTTSIYNRVPHTNNYNKTMEIIDSTDPEIYVHLSRSAPAGEHQVDVQANPEDLNQIIDPTKRANVVEHGAGHHVNLDEYTTAAPANGGNNGHITLEGRYAQAMDRLSTGYADLIGLKAGQPVADNYANLNFGSHHEHGEEAASDRDIFGYINKWAEDAEEIVRGLPGQIIDPPPEPDTDPEYDPAEAAIKQDALATIGRVQQGTADFATHLIDNSPLHDLEDGDFVHYGGQEWSPIIPPTIDDD